MIRNTLESTKAATFAVTVPDQQRDGFPAVNGTGFFITGSGYFLTANHVVEDLADDQETILEHPYSRGRQFVQGVKIVRRWPAADAALLKANFKDNKEREWLAGSDEFPYLELDYSPQEEGTAVYSFGYPLSSSHVDEPNAAFRVGYNNLSSRVTSAVISAVQEDHGMFGDSGPSFYVIDKALNYGNSGGPIVLQESGKVIALCVRFQPVDIIQAQGFAVRIPSLYGVVSSLTNIEPDMKEII